MRLWLNLPFTEYGEKLSIDKELEEKCKVVYKRDGKGGAVFHALYDEDEAYSDAYIIVPFRSVVDKESGVFPAGTNFANIEGSAGDPHKGTWIGLMEAADMKHCDTKVCCAEVDTVYAGDSADVRAWTDVLRKKTFGCGGNIVGGHVLINAKNSGRGPEHGQVLLLPICNNHNIFNYLCAKESTEKGYYMKTDRATSGLLLKNYLHIVNPDLSGCVENA